MRKMDVFGAKDSSTQRINAMESVFIHPDLNISGEGKTACFSCVRYGDRKHCKITCGERFGNWVFDLESFEGDGITVYENPEEYTKVLEFALKHPDLNEKLEELPACASCEHSPNHLPECEVCGNSFTRWKFNFDWFHQEYVENGGDLFDV